MADIEDVKVPGNSSDVTYCTVPKEEQLFNIAWLDVAPSPSNAEQKLLGYLRGRVEDLPGLKRATITVSGDIHYTNGQYEHQGQATIPFQSQLFDDFGSLTIRKARAIRGRLPPMMTTLIPGANDVVVALLFKAIYGYSGTYTFKIEAKLPDGRYLFCFKIVHRMRCNWVFK